MENFIGKPGIYNSNLTPKKREMPASKTLAFLSVTGNESIAAVERRMFSVLSLTWEICIVFLSGIKSLMLP